LFEAPNGLASDDGPVPLIKVVTAEILGGLFPLEYMRGDDQDAVPNSDDRSAFPASEA
jgi:hypothetical protein